MSQEDNAYKLLLPDIDSCSRLHRFLRTLTINTLEFIPFDDIPDGFKGVVVIPRRRQNQRLWFGSPGVSEEDWRDKAPFLWFGFRYAPPVKLKEEVPLEEAAVKLAECLEENWESCDEPKTLQYGFISRAKGIWRLFALKDVRKLGPEIHATIETRRNHDLPVHFLNQELP